MFLSYLKRSHGESSPTPKRITLKRKTVSTLRTGGTLGKKTVNVEVRKKRTYVKRDPEEVEKDQEKDAVLNQAKGLDKIQKNLENSELIKEIYVPNKIINFVVKSK